MARRATKSEAKTAAATVMPNCLKYCPIPPPIKLTGKNIATIVSVMATTAKPISSDASMAAWYGRLPRARCFLIFSISTIASSTSMPITSIKASSVIPFSV